jgi:hypothetical protein
LQRKKRLLMSGSSDERSRGERERRKDGSTNVWDWTTPSRDWMIWNSERRGLNDCRRYKNDWAPPGKGARGSSYVFTKLKAEAENRDFGA